MALTDIKLYPYQEQALQFLNDDANQIKELLVLWENGVLSRQDLIDYMPVNWSPSDIPDISMSVTPIEPVAHQLPEGIVFEELPEIDLTQGIDMQAIAEVQPISEELEWAGYTSSEIMAAGMIYAPYIPLYQTPTVHLSEIQGPRFYTGLKSKIVDYPIKKYDDIYSNIRERFEIMDL